MADLPFATQVQRPVRYDGIEIQSGYRADLIVDGRVILELKSVDRILHLHEAQILTCLRLGDCRIGLVIIANTVSLKDGIHRLVV